VVLLAIVGAPLLVAGVLPPGAVRMAQTSQSAVTAFEVVSIHPSGPNLLDHPALDAGDPCSGGAAARLQIAGARLTATLTTAYGLIALAYNPWNDPRGGCSLAKASGLISGGPEWLESERFAIEALIPGGAASYANAQLWSGAAPVLQKMLQSLLEERFQLVVRRDVKEVPVYLLTLAQDPEVAQSRIASARITGGVAERWAEGIFTGFPTDQNGNRYSSVAFKKRSMSDLAQRLSIAADIQRPVLDRTGLLGAFDFVLEFDGSGVSRPTVFAALQEQLGLRLQPSRAPAEVLVIERIQRPSPN
jgi:uncharacterized protein (TIGR03435 family)